MTVYSTWTDADLDAALKRIAAERRHYINAVGRDHERNHTIYDNELSALSSEVVRRRQAAEAAQFAAEWTLDVFNARRATWNAEAVKLPRKGNSIDMKHIRALETKLGIKMDDLRRAKALLGVD